jgi:hypothetical protein
MQPRIDDAPRIEELIVKTPYAKARPLVEEVDKAIRGPHRAAAELATSKDEAFELAERARIVLAGAKELAIAPLIELESVPPAARLFALRTVTAATFAFRERVAAWVAEALSDKDVLPVPPDKGGEEEAEPVRRVCDVAYLELRQLRHLGENGLQANLDERRYLKSTFEERDALMKKLRAEGRLRPTESDWNNT